MKDLIESEKSAKDIVDELSSTKENVHPVMTHEVTKKVDQVIINQGLTRDDFERDRVPMGANWEIEYKVYVDKDMFRQIIGELESHGVTMRGFRYMDSKGYGSILPEVRPDEM